MTLAFSAGDLVKVQRQPTGFSERLGLAGIIVEIKQSYWDYGDGECGYVEVAEVMTEKEIIEIATLFLTHA